MLFTVVESRDARLVAENSDRKLKLTLEGAAAGAFAVGMALELGGTIPVTVVATASGPVAPDPEPTVAEPSLTDGPAATFSEVTHDLSADPLAETVDEA